MLRILICDDDARALETIRSVVDQALAEAGEKASITAISNMKAAKATAWILLEKFDRRTARPSSFL